MNSIHSIPIMEWIKKNARLWKVVQVKTFFEVFKKINKKTFIQQGCIKYIKSDSKDILHCWTKIYFK